MNEVFFTSNSGTRAGRASSFFATRELAEERAEIQNKKAENMGINASYSVLSDSEDSVPSSERVRTSL